MVVNELPNVIVVIIVQYAKALSPMLVTASWNVTEVIVQPIKAESAMVVYAGAIMASKVHVAQL
jgi:hypothetical protein